MATSTGATAIRQSSCSAADGAPSPGHRLDDRRRLISLGGRRLAANPVMTHNLPRWASHGSSISSTKASPTLIGVFERVELIRTLLQREPGKPELKTFDKHIFDQR